MSVSLSVKRDRLQRQVEELEQSLSVTNTELELLSSETDDESDDDVTEAGESAAGLLALREKVQKDIQNLVNVLGTEDGPIYISDDDDSSSEESELDLTVDSCLQMNLVYQQVVQETLDQLETLLTQNHRQQKELMSQLSGPVKEPPRDQRTSSSYQQPNSLYLGRFLKPYFKDKLTGLGPPANQETKEKSSRMTGCLDDNKLKVKRWESWQKTLLIHAVTRDSLRRVMQPKLSRVDYLSQKLSSAKETDKQQLREQIDSLEREIGLLKAKKEEELFGDRYEEHDWQKISNIDFEGTKDAEDIRRFWQNFLHPSINKTRWSQEEVQQLEEVSRRHGERHWEIIAQELGTGRTAFMCLQMFQRFISGSLRRSTWSPAEDALLRELVDKMRIGNFIPYTQMSYFMEGRDPAQLIYRWNQVLDPSLKKGPWTKQEDQLLLDAVSRHGEKNWWKIRLEVPGRTDSACRDRYLDCLKEGIKRGAFDKRERDLLLQLVKKHGVGRWAKIAAEIPHRYDAQCLREWRKLIKQQLPRAQKVKAKKPRSQAGKKKASPARRRIRRRLVKVKEEEESTEEEEMVVHYMDSDEDEKKEILEVKRKEKEEEEVENEEVEKEEEEEYILPPMEEWIPSEKEEHFNFLRFQSVVLPSSADVSGGKLVRSTIAGKFGRSVITGPSPRVLKWEEHHSSNTMMMVSPDQLRAYFLCKANKFNRRGRVTEMGLGYELQAAVTPWIGNLLIPAKSRLTAADSLRERGEKTQLTSTSVFMLFLQTMNIDTTGCKEMIEQRRNNVVLLTPPPDPSSVQIKNPHTVAGMLQQKRVIKEELDTQILDQLQFFQQQQLQKQQVRPQELVQQPQPLPPQTSSVPVAQTVFIQHPVLQQQQPALNALPLSSHGIPPGGVVTSLIPAPFTPHNLSVPLASAPRPSSVLFCQQATPLTQNLKVQLAPHTTDSTVLSASSIFAAFPSPANSTLNPPAEREQIEGEWANCTGAETRALQEASEAEVETTKTPPSCQTESTNLPPQPVSLPPQQVCLASIQPVPQAPPSYLTVSPTVPQSSHAPAGIISPAAPQRLNVPPVSVESSISLQNATPSHPDRGVSTVLNLSSGSPPSSSDHDYTSINPNPTSGHHGSNSCLPTPAKQPPSQPPKNQLREKKRRRAEEQQKVEGSETDQCVDGAGTGVIQKERRVRKPSQKAKALQEATKAKAEAKMKRLSSSSPCKKRRRKSRCQDKVQVPAQPMTQLPGLCLRPGQSMWVMTPSGLLQLAEAPSQGLQLALVPTAPLPPSPGHILSPTTPRPPVPLTSGGYRLVAPKPPAVCVPVNVPNQNQPPTCSSISLPPTCVLQPVPNPISSPAPSWSSAPPVPPNVFLPYKGTVRVDPADPPSFRRETLQFDPSLMFFESQEEVRDWLSGRGGVVVSGTDAALPYLPPFVSSLSTLSALLRAKKSLTKSSLQLLSEGSKRRHPQTKLRRDSSTEKTSSQPPADLPDSTSDLRPPEDQPAPPNISELNQEEESELVALVRQLVAERFSGNPAYQLLKARFLSCFTLPALMATIQPITATTLAPEDSQEEEEEEEEKEKEEDEEVVELKKIKERGRRRRSERSLQLRSGPRTPANHFSGMNTTNTPQQPGPAETTPPVQ